MQKTKTVDCILMTADLPALGIEVDSPQPDVGGARTWNVKPDPCGNAKILLIKSDFA